MTPFRDVTTAQPTPAEELILTRLELLGKKLDLIIMMLENAEASGKRPEVWTAPDPDQS